MAIHGYVGKMLRVDLSEGKIKTEDLNEETLKKWVGGVGLGAKYLFEEVPPGVEWSDPENRLIFTAGPLGGSGVPGAGTINVMAKVPMTNMASSSQAMGFMGAYLKFSGFDGIIFAGKAPILSYLYVRDGKAEIRDAQELAGKDVFQVEDILREKLGVKEHDVSIYGIGPAGENGVLWSAIVGDRGHVASKGGLGAVMGSKNLKAIVTFKGKRNFTIYDEQALKECNNEMVEHAKNMWGGMIYKLGTGGQFSKIIPGGALPVKNYTTNFFPEHEKMNGEYIRTHYQIRSKPCYRCQIAHVKEVTVTEGKYTGFVGEEPEYEQMAAWGPVIGNTDLGAVVMLSREIDRLGMDCNEGGWLVAWVMECYEKGVFTQKETEGLDLSWGNVESVRELLNQIALKKGYLGHLLADGVRRASKKIGGEAAEWAIYAEKGSTPRGHDHRARWAEMFDTCMTNTSTLEATWAGTNTEFVDMPPVTNPFSHEEVATVNAKFNGARLFDDCVGTCRLCSPHPKLVLKCFNAVTGWNWTLQDLFSTGRRVVNLLRVFNLRHGLKIQDERPSKRYGSIPGDGPAKGKDIMEKWPLMVETYYKLMGWDDKTGEPLPETIKSCSIADMVNKNKNDAVKA